MLKKKRGNPIIKKNEGGGGAGDPPSTEPSSSTSSSKGGGNDPRSFENEELERATVQKYRRKRINEEVDRCMVIYRLNAWKKGTEEVGEDNSSDEVLRYYKGRMDFDVNANNYKWDYIAFSRRHPPPPRAPTAGRIGMKCEVSGNKLWVPGPTPFWVICPHEKVSANHCEIYPLEEDEDHAWIRDDNSEHGTFVNGKRIPKGERYPLRDGDIISLGSPHHSKEHWGHPNKKRGFVFKVKCFRRRDEEDDQLNREPEDVSSPEFLALNNNVVVGEILNFLSQDDLKTARLINNFWKGMADPKLFSLRVLKLRNNSSSWDDSPETETYTDILLMMERYKFRTWRIDYAYEDYLPDEIVNLIKIHGHLARNIQLGINYSNPDFEDQFISTLRRLPNVESLHLILTVSLYEEPYRISIIKSEATFPSVKHLFLDVEELDLDLGLMKDMVLQVAKLFPNIEKVTTKTPLYGLLLPISMHNLWTSRLKEVGGRITRGERVYDIIRALPHKLRKLELYGIPAFKDPLEMASFENMLEIHATTLEHLVLRFKIQHIDYEEDEEEAKPILRFPSFPKLKTLQLLSRDQDDLDFQIVFPSSSSGSICYEKDFPVIKELRLMMPRCSHQQHNEEEDYLDWDFDCDCDSKRDCSFNKSILNVFVPKDSVTVSGTMTWIEFGLEGELRKKGNPWYVEFVDRFRRMFPYVHHPNLNEEIQTESEDEESESSSEDEDEEGSGEPAKPQPPPPTGMRNFTCCIL